MCFPFDYIVILQLHKSDLETGTMWCQIVSVYSFLISFLVLQTVPESFFCLFTFLVK